MRAGQKRHFAIYFDLAQAEVNAINSLLVQLKSDIGKEDQKVTGFNIGMNSGESADQAIFHRHIQLIP